MVGSSASGAKGRGVAFNWCGSAEPAGGPVALEVVVGGDETWRFGWGHGEIVSAEDRAQTAAHEQELAHQEERDAERYEATRAMDVVEDVPEEAKPTETELPSGDA